MGSLPSTRLLALMAVAASACASTTPAPAPAGPPPPPPGPPVAPDGRADAAAPDAAPATVGLGAPALYVARMHRAIHPHWGNGFLLSLDVRPPTDPLNRAELSVTVEVTVVPDGSIGTVTVARTSGQPAFDDAAVAAIRAAAPFRPVPETIRGRTVQLRWTFHRDARECGTAGVELLGANAPGPRRDGGVRRRLPDSMRRRR
jgi:TonB family protein